MAILAFFLIPDIFFPRNARNKVCMAPFHVQRKIADFAPHTEGSNAAFSPHMEGSHPDFAPHIDQRHSFENQKKVKFTVLSIFVC